MKNQEAIEFLNNLQKGMFCTIHLPVYSNKIMQTTPMTVMYMGKDVEGRYNFMATGNFVMSKDFIENKAISIDKDFNKKQAAKIYSQVYKFNKNKNEKVR